MTSLRSTGPAIVFGRYRLTPDPLRLTGDGVPVIVGARALALLLALVEAEGRPVSFADLATRIWGRTNVEINSVQAQVSALRRALGADRDLIVTMAGSGYRFAGTVKKWEAPGAAADVSEPAPAYAFSAALHVPHPCAARMPLHGTPFVGRYAELSELLGLMSISRVITLVGGPGLGKTRLAHEVARRVATHFPDGIGSVTLSPQVPPDDLIRTLALALGIEPAHGWGTAERFGAAIGARRLLLVVDCCEPLRRSLGNLVDKLATIASGLQVIVTGTAPLRIEHERVVEVGSLSTPDRIDINVEEALTFDAFRLLFTRLAVLQNLDRGQARQRRSVPIDINPFAMLDLGRLPPEAVAMAASVTRQLGGTPFALELAASAIMRRMSARVPLQTALRAFATSLDECVLRGAGRRGVSLSPEAAIVTMLELHNVAFDDATRAQLRRLGIFGGVFSRGAAIAMLTQFAPSRDDSALEKPRIDARCEARLDELLRAGLVEQFEGEQAAMLRLPGAVRLFAIDALAQTNELGRAAAAQARSLAARLETQVTHGVWPTGDSGEHHEFERELELEALRSALTWAIFNDRLELATTLVEASAPLWRQLSLVQAYLRTVRFVMARVSASAQHRPREEMRLWKSLALALSLAQAPRQEITAAWRRTYELAIACADPTYRQHAMAGLIECSPETWRMHHPWGLQAPRERIAQTQLKATCQIEA